MARTITLGADGVATGKKAGHNLVPSFRPLRHFRRACVRKTHKRTRHRGAGQKNPFSSTPPLGHTLEPRGV